MIAAPIPENDKIRMKALRSFSILDTFSEKEYDEITLLACAICDTPMSLISLVDEDRQWFKSKIGLALDETPRELSFCSHAILNNGELFTIEDSRIDERFCDNPLVIEDPNVVFYAGAPLVTSEGFSLGTLCVLDSKPRKLTEVQQKAIKVLSNKVVSLFELKKANLLLERKNKELEEQRLELEIFAKVAAYDVKSPLSNISGLTEVLIEDYENVLGGDVKELLELVNISSHSLKKLVDRILDHSKTGLILQRQVDVFDLKGFMQEVIQIVDGKGIHGFSVLFGNEIIVANKTALQQIFISLIENSVKFNDKDQIEIEIGFAESEKEYQFYVSDNGMGIGSEYQDKIFDLFEFLEIENRFGNNGNGIGFSTVKKIIEGLGGTISVDSEINIGTKVSFSLLK
jgi:signal transduction histidine kinase